MSSMKSKAPRRSHRWMGSAEFPLESRQLMSTAAAPPWVQAQQVHGALRQGRLGRSWATYLTVENRSAVPVRIGISEVDNYDWDGDSRPDHNLDGVVLAPGESVSRREEVNGQATQNFRITLYNATTGEQIATARANSYRDFDREGSGQRFLFWGLSPNSQKFDSGGASFTFFAKPTYQVDNWTGTFVLDETAQARPRLRLGYGSSQGTNLTIENQSKTAVRIGISNIDDYDWDGDSRPDHNLDGVVLAPGESVTRREETNAWASPNFTISLLDAETGERIGSSRATFQMHPEVMDDLFAWTLEPTAQVFRRAGGSLSFRSTTPSILHMYEGTFVIEDASGAVGRPRVSAPPAWRLLMRNVPRR